MPNTFNSQYAGWRKKETHSTYVYTNSSSKLVTFFGHCLPIYQIYSNHRNRIGDKEFSWCFGNSFRPFASISFTLFLYSNFYWKLGPVKKNVDETHAILMPSYRLIESLTIHLSVAKLSTDHSKAIQWQIYLGNRATIFSKCVSFL